MPEFKHLLLSIFRADGFPLSYFIFDYGSPDHTTTFKYFVVKCVAFALLNGTYYDADKSSVHTFVVLFTWLNMSKGWVKPVAWFKDGSHNMMSLRDRFSCELN